MLPHTFPANGEKIILDVLPKPSHENRNLFLGFDELVFANVQTSVRT